MALLDSTRARPNMRLKNSGLWAVAGINDRSAEPCAAAGEQRGLAMVRESSAGAALGTLVRVESMRWRNIRLADRIESDRIGSDWTPRTMMRGRVETPVGAAASRKPCGCALFVCEYRCEVRCGYRCEYPCEYP